MKPMSRQWAAVVAACAMSLWPAEGAWNGLGVPGGTGDNDVCAAANWEKGVVNGDFSTITATNATVTLKLSGNLIRTDSAVLTSNLVFASGTNLLSVSNASLAPGLLVSGAFINYNTMISGVDAANGTIALSQPTTGATTGTNLTFILPSFNFNFGVRGAKASGVSVAFVSDSPGVQRTVSVSQRLVMSQLTGRRNSVTFSPDIKTVIASSEGSITRESNASGGGTYSPLLTLNGPVDLSTGPGVAMNGGDLTLNGPVSGVGKYIKMWQTPKTLTLNCPSNTFSGTVWISNNGQTVDDVVRYASIANAGFPSALGAGNLVVLGQPNTGTNIFEYTGDADGVSDKELRLSGAYGLSCNRILSTGDGTVTFSGKLSQEMSTSTTAGRRLNFGGTGNGAFTGLANLTNVVNGTAVGSVVFEKSGTGTWRFSGTNMNYTGVTHVMAGDLVLDYGNCDQLSAASNAVALRGGALTFRGGAAGTATDTVATVKINDTVANNYVCSKLILDANGGAGVSLTVSNLSVVTPDVPLMYTLLDLSSSANNALTFVALANSVTTAQRGELMQGNFNTQARFVLKNADGYCFPTTNGSGRVVAPAMTALPTSGFDAGTRYQLATPGATTLAASGANVMSLTVDSSAGAVTLNTGAYSIGPNGYGKGGGLLCRGSNDVTITGSGAFACSMWSYFNFLNPDTALLRVDLTLNTIYTTWGGSGVTAYSGTGLGTGGNFVLCGGVFRMTTAQTLSMGRLVLTYGGVFELGADLNGTTAGDFTLACGTGNNQVLLYGDAGFSAYGANRVVNLGGAAAILTWGANGFLTHQEGYDYGCRLKLSSPCANAAVEFQNPIDLNGDSKEVRRRTVEVADGAAAIDAVLSGALSGHSTLVKTGVGTLKVTAPQTYDALRVCAGRLLAADGCFASSNAVPVLLKSGATLAGVSGSGNTFGTLTLTGDASLDVGDGSAALTFADSSAVDWAGSTLTIIGKLQNGKVRFGITAGGVTAAQLASIKMTGDFSTRIDADGYLVRVPHGTVLSIL
jgi:autotransporter-associated beta strand protein